ncbi:ribosomal-protein-alanine N-acetyltransferase [Streptomyces rubradiris]|uniref:Ribosomal-protein-alanine N-acetyltransferase n=1 Tax=Streptomyces rubradiris TaxID=285531 RepID=A0ABQ3RQZ9_STRRR|nr:GNAT family N-acetyltransferase [Streptomyces rubradiris]GHI58306.1 ribosomal-protein-alanine N-acetyltransferase [Streptomyces rubradiris]
MADTGRRPDGRLYISIDAWHDTAFDRLAAAMLAELPAPLYTLVDADDADTISNWRRAGFTLTEVSGSTCWCPAKRSPPCRPRRGVTLTGGAEESRAEVEGVEVGVIRISPSMRDNGRPRIARIRSIEVRADQRRRGIGRALLVHALDALHTREFGLATIDVDETDTATISLLESVGARRESNTWS